MQGYPLIKLASNQSKESTDIAVDPTRKCSNLVVTILRWLSGDAIFSVWQRCNITTACALAQTISTMPSSACLHILVIILSYFITQMTYVENV